MPPACAEAGASIYHLHVRDADGSTDDGRRDAIRAAHDAIRQRTDLIVQFTSGGAVSDDAEVASWLRSSSRPEMATLTTGTVNFGDEVFLNPLASDRLASTKRMRSISASCPSSRSSSRG